MISSDGAKGVQGIKYVHTETWDRNLRVERKETKDDGDQSDAKNRQKTSYEEILVKLLETLKNEIGEPETINVEK
jgi:hypothetical protein